MIEQSQISELDFNVDFGDFVLELDDVPLINNRKKFILSYIHEKLKTDVGDIYELPTFGTRLDRYVGKGITQALIEDIKLTIRDSLTSDGILLPTDFEIFHIVRNNNLELRIIVETETMTFSTNVLLTNEGVTIDY